MDKVYLRDLETRKYLKIEWVSDPEQATEITRTNKFQKFIIHTFAKWFLRKNTIFPVRMYQSTVGALDNLKIGDMK